MEIILITEKQGGQDKWVKDALLALSELHTDELEIFHVGIGGVVLGYRADRIYIDSRIDPVALNEQQRQWFTGSLACRLGPGGEAAIITIKEGADAIVEPIHRSLISMSNDFPTCNHPVVEPRRDAALRRTELVCTDCEATWKVITDLQEAEMG
jgi:hypothetical protein